MARSPQALMIAWLLLAACRGPGPAPEQGRSAAPDSGRMAEPVPICQSPEDEGLSGRIRQQIGARLALHPGDVVVDIGAGGGVLTFVAARAAGPGGRVIATDIDEGAVRRLRAAAASARSAQPELAPIEVRQVRGPQDTALDDLPPASVDLVLLINVFGFARDGRAPPETRRHRPEDVAYLARVARALKPGGRIVTHLDWLGSDMLRADELAPLFADAGFDPVATSWPLPPDMPEQAACASEGGGIRTVTTFTRGYILEVRRAAPAS